MREEIPPLFGLTFNIGSWNQGFVRSGHCFFLLVTLEKGGLHKDFDYEDEFLSADVFKWQSQRQITQSSSTGQKICGHVEEGIEVHLFVRKTKLLKGKAAPFYYCGQVEFMRWEWDQPITVWWKLLHSVSEPFHNSLKVPK